MTFSVSSMVDADSWLTDVMGTSVFRVNTDALAEAPSSAADALSHHAAAQRSAMYYARVPAARVDLVQTLQAAGFSVIDVAVTFSFESVATHRAPQAHVVVGDLADNQAAAVLEIAGSCFRYSRFHLDPRVPLDVAHRVKREWIQSYVSGRRGERLMIATLDGRPAGFLAVVAAESAGAQAYVIDLVGVANWAQRRGVGRALVQAFINRYHVRGVTLRVGTQVANIPSIRLYEQLGFSLSSSHYVLHRHVGSIPGHPAA